MEHGEAHGHVKTPVASDILGCVLAQNAYIIGLTAAKLVGERTVDLYAGEARDAGAQEIG
jgi:hypothetical protein